MPNQLIIAPLGAGNEVGRSCIHIKYGGTEILLDCGIHPAYTGPCSLPYFDLVDLKKIDAVFITHFHLDHGGGLPFLTEKTDFKGDIYMTHPTKTILKWLLNDYIRLLNTTSDNDNFTDADLNSCHNKIKAIDYYQEIRIKNMKIVALNAGHVLGAAMFLIEIGNYRILYTGDYSREEDRHLKAADLPTKKINLLICESTYGVGCHLAKKERESRFISEIKKIVSGNGKCLLPVFALGRAQELLLILEEYWETQNINIPIYYISGLAKKCLNVYQTYLNMMNERIQKMALTRNPFSFKYVKNITSMNDFKDDGPLIMVASPGMLQSGVSRELFERWCENSTNGVIITGYSVSGTLAKEILNEPTYIESMGGQKLQLKMSVSFISFSAHVDFIQNSEFIEMLMPEFLIFVHGEINEMSRLRNAIAHRNPEIKIFLLKNGEYGEYPVDEDLVVFIEPSLIGREFEALMVVNENTFIYESHTINMIQRKTLTSSYTPAFIKSLLLAYFLDEFIDEGDYIKIQGVHISLKDVKIKLEWTCSCVNDLLAMTITRIITEDGLESIKMSSLNKYELMVDVLRNYFKQVTLVEEKIYIKDVLGSVEVDNDVASGDEAIVLQAQGIIDMFNNVYG